MSLILNGTTGISDVDGTAAAPALTGTDTNTGIFFPAADTIAFAEGGVEAARFDSSGNLGIGTSSPNAKLTIASEGRGRFYRSDNTRYGDVYTDNSAFNIVSTFDPIVINAASGDGVRFQNGGTERARFDSSGNLLVGKTVTTFTTDGVWLQPAGTAWLSRTSDISLVLNRNGTDGQTAQFYKAGTQVGNISVTGSATAYNTSSDYRLKEAIAPMTGALAKVALLKPCTYKWKVDGSDGQGFIAHELAEVEAGCVTGEKDAVDAEGKPQYQGIDTSFLVATLTAAIQEQQALITALTTRITALEAA